jgi:LexA-binding, inner membrane-associated putative hydrolase
VFLKKIAKTATIDRHMPTPVGHALGGLAAAWMFRRRAGLALACVLAAVVPDLDLLFRSHRAYTHSIGAVAIVALVAWLVMRRGPHTLGSTLAMTAAYGSHLLLDWLGKDSSNPPGLMALWPFSSGFYISGLDLFKEVSRRYWSLDEFVLGNLNTLGWELLTLGPLAALAWLAQRKGRGRRGKG